MKSLRYYEKWIEKELDSGGGRNVAADERAPSESKKKKLKVENEDVEMSCEINNNNQTSLELVVAIYKFLQFDFAKYSRKWNYSKLVNLVQTEQNGLVRYFGFKICSMLIGLTPIQEDSLMKKNFDQATLETVSYEAHQIILNDRLKLATNFDQKTLDIFKTQEDSESGVPKFIEFDNLKLRVKQEQHEGVKESGGVFDDLVFVNTAKKNLNKIVMSVITDSCIVVDGPLSSGKTTLIEYLAFKSNNKLIKYQMDEFMDSKSLIGNYICSDIPGEFLWKPGPLYQAVSGGNWILLEDFDHSPLDTLSLIIDLLETKCIKTSDTVINIKSDFRLFLTLRSSDSKRANMTFIESIKKLSRHVILDQFTNEEIIQIICSKYPYFSTLASANHIADKLLDVYKSLSDECFTASDTVLRTNLIKDARLLTLRDLLKLCKRLVNVDTKNTSIEHHRHLLLNLLHDVYECFLSFLSNKEARVEFAVKVGCMFNINREEILALLVNDKPNFQKTHTQLVCGRVKLPAVDTSRQDLLEQSYIQSSKFVYTRASLSLMEKIARCIECNEPVLLCGETGVGKTTALQHLARILGKSISVINLNQQTETSDLLGSFKPVDVKVQMKLVKEKFVDLFTRCFGVEENQSFLNHVQTCFTTSNWSNLVKLLTHATDSAYKKFQADKTKYNVFKEWKEFRNLINKLAINLDKIKDKFSFQFFEGKLSQAIVNGEWIILDEINLASAETLQFLGTLLEDTGSKSSSIILYEKGDNDPLIRHPEFRLFGAMNPASDVGKRNLPSNIRNRFTEIFVDELDSEHDLTQLIKSYLDTLSEVNNDLIKSIVEFFLSVKKSGGGGDSGFIKKLTNGVGMPPTYSLRTLCRGLRYAANNYCNNTLLSVYDGICLSFLTDLNRESSVVLEEHIKNMIVKRKSGFILPAKIQRVKPKNDVFLNEKPANYVNIEDYWILRGLGDCHNDPTYIFTKSAKDNLKRIARVCSARLPCLVQGDTSIGKTSLIKWLARATGNTLIRINNHDHTDLQEYIGSYVVDPISNKLSFKEGLLVKAMRQGYWLLLDELNLASSEVLEALNRVLDDNRELYIPETQEIVRAHPRFLLFATQNPPGKYAGRKQLSRAFRNRFIELHFDELLDDELLTIVEQKCQLPKTYATLLVKTIGELKTKRSQVSGIFLGKNSLITLRDLFRWARRYTLAHNLDKKIADSSTSLDWKQYLAEQGVLLLCARCRAEPDVLTIHGCIEKVFGKKVDISNLYNPTSFCWPIMSLLERIQAYGSQNEPEFVWTPSAKRLALLSGLAYTFNEPFLLVGDTGLGKTTICQILSRMSSKSKLHIINCHMHSEAADFLGSIRPVREGDKSANGQLFEWKDGPLVEAIKNGEDFLIDEISLADDSVLERLNSVLEEEKTLLLAENIDQTHSLKAHEAFRIFSTMNPSGDFGKKELSAALRNRFTEIWCPSPTNNAFNEFKIIVESSLAINHLEIVKPVCVTVVCEFLSWLGQQSFFKKCNFAISIRDLTAWIKFINKTYHLMPVADNQADWVKPILALVHGACLIFIDSLSVETDTESRSLSMSFIFNTINQHLPSELSGQLKLEDLFAQNLTQLENNEREFRCGAFSVSKGSQPETTSSESYCYESNTTRSNLQRIMRCMVMQAPIMLEGSPGVGKTSLVEALGRITRQKVIRINLSEQTDLNELFGADLPCCDTKSTDTGGLKQKFAWHDGPFLMALKKGYWIILDEINLASQSVLEGLNSCFDHRSEVFISELNKSFKIDSNQTRIFACQNPYTQGGGRKGLPKSFLNRFSKVYIDQMTQSDLFHIVKQTYSDRIDSVSIERMIVFNERINRQVCVERQWGTLGSPWEFNLRDLFRWCDLMVENSSQDPGDFVYLIYGNRFRCDKDRARVYQVYREVFEREAYQQDDQIVRFASTHLQIGQSFLIYNKSNTIAPTNSTIRFSLTNKSLKHLESVMKCIEMNWMSILVGHSCTGKTSLIRLLANLSQRRLIEFSVNSSTDTSDLLGGYEKIKHLRQDITHLASRVKHIYMKHLNMTTSVQNLKLYLGFLFESNRLHKQFDNDHGDEDKCDRELVAKMVSLYETQLKKLSTLQSVAKVAKDRLECETLIKSCERIRESMSGNVKDNSRSMKFEWIDSSLVKAIENGDWVLIDNANFCSPSVLDRLNPLLERSSGLLQINEKGIQPNGKIYQIKAHKNFRLFLTMNESFGELSRPMRNRGLEIYLDEYSIDKDLEDVLIILQTLYPFASSESNNQLGILLSKCVQVGQALHFSDLLKMLKLVYDYWLLCNKQSDHQTLLQQAFDQMLNDLKLEMNESKTSLDLMTRIAQMSQSNFSSQVGRLREFKLYQFLFNFPLYEHLIESLSSMASHEISSQASLDKYTSFLLEAFKTTQLVDKWVRQVPSSQATLIVKFVQQNLPANSAKLSNLFHIINQFAFNDSSLVAFRQQIEQMSSSQQGLDLSNETVSVDENRFLWRKFDQDQVAKLAKSSKEWLTCISLYLSKFRVESLYTTNNSSLVAMVDKIDQTGSMRFLSRLTYFYQLLLQSLVDSRKMCHLDQLDEHVLTRTLYIVEKFYAIGVVCSYDPVLTMSYLKYYWNFIEASFTEIEKYLPNCWSIDFESMRVLFNQGLYFDDSVYKIFYSLWQQIRSSRIDVDSLSEPRQQAFLYQLQQELLSNSLFNASNYNNLIKHKFYDNFQQISNTKLTTQLMNSTQLSVAKIEDRASSSDNLVGSLLAKLQIIPLRHYLNMLNNLESQTTTNLDLYSISNLTELVTLGDKMSLFYQMYTKSSTSCFGFIDFVVDKLVQNQQSADKPTARNIFNYNWLDEYLSQAVFFFDQCQSPIRAINLTLDSYLDKYQSLNQLTEFLWLHSNKVTNVVSIFSQIENQMIEYLQNVISTMKIDYFENSDEKLITYLVKKGFQTTLLDLFSKYKTKSQHDRSYTNKIDLLLYGCMIVFCYNPMEPLDPLEYEQLVERNEMEFVELKKHQERLNEVNKSKLKRVNAEQDPNSLSSNKTWTERGKKADYFLITNELEMNMRQFCSSSQIGKFLALFSRTDNDTKLEEAYKIWMTSIQNFVQKLMTEYYSYSDIIHLPICGLSMIGYALNALYTSWRSNIDSRLNQSACNLVKSLIKYPIEENTASEIIQNSVSLHSTDPILTDELNTIALLHLVSDKLNKKHQPVDKNESFVKLCSYFSHRYQAYKEDLDKQNQVESYKYKTYGQKEIEEELIQAEMESEFPTFGNVFEEFLSPELSFEKEAKKPVDPLEDNNLPVDQASSLNEDLYAQIFDLFEFYLIDSSQNSQVETELLIKTFYRAYSLSSHLINKTKVSLELNTHQPQVLSHILFASSINLHNSNFDLELNPTCTTNIYHDANPEQVLRFKTYLDGLKSRINDLLRLDEFIDNPILVELMKLAQKLETFNLNDPLMKYLTGIELLLQKAESWKQVAPKMYSLDEELKLLSNIVLEWRKLELKFWVDAMIDNEMTKMKKKNGFAWFFNLVNVCDDYLSQANNDESQKQLLSSLNQFIQNSTHGEYSTRLRCIEMCHLLFKSKNNSNLSSILHSLINYYRTLFSSLIEQSIQETQKQIKKELKDFVDIYKWQDWNFMSLKQSINKVNKTLFKTMRKFRVFLSEQIDFNKLIRNKVFVIDVGQFSLITRKYLNNFHRLEFTVNVADDIYMSKAVKFCKKLLNLRFNKNSFNKTLTQFAKQIYERFVDLDKETKALLSSVVQSDGSGNNKQSEVNKQLVKKHKKDFKYLNQQKLKFISDLIKELTELGLSYRRGNIIELKGLEETILIGNPEEFKSSLIDKDLISSADKEFYSSATNFYRFQSQETTVEQANLMAGSIQLPIEKFIGFTKHLFNIIYEQRVRLNDSLNNVLRFDRFTSLISAIGNNSTTDQLKLKTLIDNLAEMNMLIAQIDLFFTHVAKDSSLNKDQKPSALKQDYDLVHDAISTLRSSSKKIVSFIGSDLSLEYSSTSELRLLQTKLEEETYFDHINRVNQSLLASCQPFVSSFEKASTKLADVRVESSTLDIEEAKSDETLSYVIDRILKSIEILFKKYVTGEPASLKFYTESTTNLSQDTDTLHLVNLSRSLKKLLDQNHRIDGQLIAKLNSYCSLFKEFTSKWIVYLYDMHVRSCQLLNVVIFIFDEFKSKGLQVPKDFEMEDGDEGEGNDDNQNRKFETNDDPTGLGDGQGQKDVSDQIETEDQLDDAKRKEDYEKEKDQEQDQPDIKEEEKGIEMSEDFEADLQDIEKKEDDNKTSDNEKESDDEELDDQKGSVNDPMENLDKQLWEDENLEDENQEQEPNEQEDEEGLQGGEPLANQESELAAKEDMELPMVDHEENQNENDQQQDPLEQDIESMNIDDEDEVNEESSHSDVEDPDKGSDQENDNEENDPNQEKNIEDTEDIDESENNQGENPEEEENNEMNSMDTKKLNTDVNQFGNESEKKKNQTNNDSAESLDEKQNDQENNDENVAEESEITQSDANQSEQKNQSSSASNKNKNSDRSKESNRQKLRETNENRSMADEDDKNKKLVDKSNVIDVEDENSENKKPAEDENQEMDQDDFKHVKDDDKNVNDKRALDAANENQKQKLDDDEKMIVEQKDDDKSQLEENETEDKPKTQSERVKEAEARPKTNKDKESKSKEGNETEENDTEMRESGDFVQTMGTSGGPAQSIYETNNDGLKMSKTREELEQELIEFRKTYMQQLKQESEVNSELLAESSKLWLDYEILTRQLSKELCEQLRLILEPTVCSKLKGDYKTGKRLNMKRVIEYIATEYRKDKIWLRRTKPNKRDYQVMLAVDNSSSMSDNHCMELTYETICTLANAFNYLEVGQLGLVSFGTQVNLLHELSEQFGGDFGARVLSQVNFKDDRTKIAEMLNVSIDIFNNAQSRSAKSSSTSTVPVSKLLIILSDGRGIFYEGIEKVKTAVQNALVNGIFIVFVIIDIPGKNTNSSIYDIKMPVYLPGNPMPIIKSYMENFPFPFYVVLREINTLPNIMIEALKQWFEMVTKIDSV